MTPNEHAYFGLCLAVWQQGVNLYMDRLALGLNTFNALFQVESSDTRASRARAAFRIVS